LKNIGTFNILNLVFICDLVFGVWNFVYTLCLRNLSYDNIVPKILYKNSQFLREKLIRCENTWENYCKNRKEFSGREMKDV